MAWRNIDIELSLPDDLPTRGHELRAERGPAPGPDSKRASVDTNRNGPMVRPGVSRASEREAVSMSPRPSNVSSIPEKIVRLAAEQVVDLLREIDRDARHAGRTVPTGEERDAVASSFWAAVRQFTLIHQWVSDVERARCARAVRQVLHPWLLRSDYWSRSYLKPHGYAGDFRMLEWVYDLESDRCADPTRPAVVNLLDYLYSTVHSVRAVWHRRKWYANRIEKLRATTHERQPVRVLDLACGGSRYVRDCLHIRDIGRGVELTLLDQDPAALAFIDEWLPSDSRPSTRLICGPVRDALRLVDKHAPGRRGQFDLVISTGLFDYLDDAAAGRLLAEMCRLVRPGGSIAVCNFAPQDPSRIVKDWVVDWPLIYRDCSALRALVPDSHSVWFDRSSDGGLVYALIGAPTAAPHRRSAENGHHVAD
jgi:SAM-dependent methyltransferase